MVSCHSPCFVRETVTIYNVNVQGSVNQLVLLFTSWISFFFFLFLYQILQRDIIAFSQTIIYFVLSFFEKKILKAMYKNWNSCKH